jgi:hypothetical protein
MKLISISVNSSSSDAFIATLLAILLDMNSNDVQPVIMDFKRWAEDSKEFLTEFGMRKQYTKYLNIFLLRKGFTEEHAQELAALLKDKVKEFDGDKSISFAQLKLIKNIITNLRTASDRSWQNIHKEVAALKMPRLISLFTDEEPESVAIDGVDAKKAAKALGPLVKKFTGRANSCFLTMKESQRLREEDPDTYSQYAKLVKVLNTATKKEVQRYVRASGKDLVSIEDLRSHFQKIGLTNNLPVGFIGGQMDEKGQGWTKEGKLLDRAPIGAVKMNPKYDPATDNTYVMLGLDFRHYYRTVDFLGSNQTKRFGMVHDFINNEDGYRKLWLTDLDKDDKNGVLAAIVELLYSTSLRIGGEGNATAGETTYGVTTMLVGHIKLTPSAIEISYLGKKKGLNTAVYKTNTPVAKKVRRILSTLLKGKNKDDMVFTYKGKPVKAAAVRAYLLEKNIPLSPHKFRNIAATRMAMDLLKKAPFKKSEKPKQSAVESWVKKEFEKIGELLSHRTGDKVTSSTALKSYIDPGVLIKYFDDLGLRKPNFLKSPGAK